MEEEKETKKVGERRTQAQRLKRVLVETTPKHLEQLTKQARSLAGEDVDEDVPSLAITRAKLAGLQHTHLKLRERLSGREKVDAERLQFAFASCLINRPHVRELDVQEWNDSLISTMCNGAESQVTNNTLREKVGRSQVYQFDTTKIPFHLPGKTVCSFTGGRIGVQFETSFAGKSLESFYCVLSRKSSVENFSVNDHSIPFFLPLREIEKQHISTSVTKFIDHIGQALQAYVSRREQISLFKDLKGDKIGNLYHSLPYNLIEFSMEEANCMLEVSLAYDNLESELPTRSLVSLWPLQGDQHSRSAGRRGNKTSFLKHSASWTEHAEDRMKKKLLMDGDRLRSCS
ncbi:hypothetical protein O6H91_11G032700 [Diphasiastrum complanatum]|uniref:Uncharacterized protein n=1 Tax=Diphasiastrum complanatum TaxID=34168 RepID=A0ACC2C7R6_DIPCM|nr:hypothetical protein O6H91_11G032700 [Diphasiastrum complanatum]